MRGRLIAVVGILAVSGLFAAVATSCGNHASSTAAAGAPGAGPGATGATGPRIPAGPTGATAGSAGVEPLADLPQVGPNIIKTGHLSIEVERGGFDDAFDRASVVAGTYGGFVESSSSQGVKHRSGSLTIRVPAASFEDALHDLRAIGTVQRQSITGRDVTSQFVDIDARLRNFETQEKVLLRLLSKATTIEGTLRVQRTLSDVQLHIEELTGERRVLSNRAELSTIQVELFEAGAPPVVHTQTVAIEKPKLGEALTRAEAVFLGLVYGIVVALAVLIPLSLLALLVWLLVRRYRARVPA
ncbi:MAG: DUF4349 domain-containing protein [Actinomycetota bacterium]|nr:DUF4349 domain-containing protein [Actinomycetota bacterium]